MHISNFYILGAVLICSLLSVSPVRAAEVKLRSGAHSEYSRLVFDWQSRVGYEVERPQKNRLVVSFDKAAQLDAAAAQSNPVPNITALDVLSTDPLRVTLNIPEDSRIRNLRAGNKVVIDVYHPPGGPQAKTALNVTKPPAKAKPEQPKKVEKKSEEKTEEKPAAPAAVPPAEVVAVPVEEGKPQGIKLKARELATEITTSSFQNFGMAAFELAGRLWLVSDKTDLLLKPQLSGPLAEEFQLIEHIDADQGKAHIVPAPVRKKFKGHGGGAVWKILISDDLVTEDAPEPLRSGVNRQSVRSGKLLWPLKGARKVVDFKDPLTGRDVKVVTVVDAKQFSGPPREFVDFDVLHSVIGLAIVPKTSDVSVQIVRGGVEISRPDGLTMIDGELLASMTSRKETKDAASDAESAQRIFDFKAWQLGGVKAAHENKRVILGGLMDETEVARSENLITLGKMYASNGMGPEAQGVLNFAALERPDLWSSPEFSALYGVAATLSNHHEEAYGHLSRDILKSFGEIQFWRSYIFAAVGDWAQAGEVLPDNLGPLQDYPVAVQNRILPELAEVALRAGDLEKAQKILKLAEGNKDSMLKPQRAALMYLQGEAARQKGDTEKTIELWEPLATGKDDLYRAKAGLALTRLKINQGEMTPEDSVDNLERLRYAWRGDQLEVTINYWLGRTYFEAKDYLRGLKIMRDAVTYDTGTPLGQRVAGEMGDLFSDLFLGPDLDEVSPLDAVSLYEEFKELVPLDERGDTIIERLAEHLATADLFARAGNLLKYQMDHRLQGVDIYRIGVRLAAIRLLDNQPDQAIAALNTAAAKLEELPDELKTPKRYRTISMLRARALSRKGRPDQALALLNDLSRTPDMNRLRADIAWTAGYWDDAAEALGDVVLDQNISLTRPLKDENTALLLQQAVALNLAGDRIALANMREKYTDLMKQTDKAKIFDVITRPRQRGVLADRDTLLSVVSEVDLFKEFLNSYKSVEPPTN